jgi:hypothetical protein
MSNIEDKIKHASVGPARSTDPGTAHKAASANHDVRGTQRLAVFLHLKACGQVGATDYETGLALDILRTSAGKRRKELCELGFVENSGERRETDTQSTAIVWRLSKQAEQEVSV